LFNSHSFPVDISGYYLTDTTNNKTQFRIPNGTIIPAGGHLVVWADGDNATNGVHANFNLSRTRDSIIFYQPDGLTLIDSVTFSNQLNNVSEGRYPDGTPTRFSFDTPTPGAANTLGGGGNNTPPTLAAITDKSVTLGQTLSFTVSATDTDSPPQTLSFSLDAAPGGATIGVSGGLFSWAPNAAQVPSTNTVTVRVTDNGAPPMNATRTFTIRAYPPARATITRSGGSISLAFNTVAGKTYRVEFRDDLSPSTSWAPLGDPAVASGSSMTIPDTIGAHLQRFYRIVQLD